MEPTDQNGNQSEQLAQAVRREERLVALYMELTGANQNEARSICASLETIGDQNRGWNSTPGS